MNRFKRTLFVAGLTIGISSTALAGTIPGARTNRTGTIVGARSGNIAGTRTGNIAGTSIVTRIQGRDMRSSFRILISENIGDVLRLFLESRIF